MKLEKQQWKGTMSAEYQWHGFVNIAFKLVVLTYLGRRRHILQQLNQRPGKRIVPLMFFSPHPYPNLGKKASRLNSNSVREVVLFYLYSLAWVFSFNGSNKYGIVNHQTFIFLCHVFRLHSEDNRQQLLRISLPLQRRENVYLYILLIWKEMVCHDLRLW